jgi:hypothetical protein
VTTVGRRAPTRNPVIGAVTVRVTERDPTMCTFICQPTEVRVVRPNVLTTVGRVTENDPRRCTFMVGLSV